MDRERLDRWCERGILGLLLAILVYGPLATGTFRSQDFLVVQWLTLGVAVVWMARLAFSSQSQLYWPPIAWLVLAFLIYAWIRYWTSDIEYVAREECLRVLVYVLIFLAFLSNIRQPKHLDLVVSTVLAVALFIALYAVVQYLTGSDRVWHFQRPAVYAQRGSGTYINPNHMAGYLEMVLPLALTSMMNARFSLLPRILFCYAALVIFVAILVSFSRGGWIGCAAGILPLLIWLCTRRNYRWQGCALLVAVFVIGLIFAAKARVPPDRQGEMQTIQKGENIRLLIWKATWSMYLDHPWWGVGPDHFDERFRQYRPEHPDMQVRPDRVHNDYLNALADWGAVGGTILFLMMGFFIKMSWTHWKRSRNLPLGSMPPSGSGWSRAMGSSLGLVALLAHSFFDYNLHVPANAVLAVTLLAIVVRPFNDSLKDRHLFASGRILRLVNLVLVFVCAAYLASQCWTKTRATMAVRQADAHLPCSDNQIASLKEAFRHQPQNHEIPYRIGECLRLRSWQSRSGYREQAREAIEWFERSTQLNPYDPYSLVKKGMCLDWLDNHSAAELWYQRALDVDPNGYYINALMGWHYLQDGNLEEAKEWFERSLRLFPNTKNFIASYYLGRVNSLLNEKKEHL